MADPTTIVCDQNFWEQVALNVTAGVIHLRLDPVALLRRDRLPRVWYTFRDTGNPAPVDHPTEEEGILVLESSITIQTVVPLDLYIYPEDAELTVVAAL